MYKSRNLLDDQVYAVKKITLRVRDMKNKLEEEIERILQEVRLLAKVNHPNILRYYNSWLEVVSKDKKEHSPNNMRNDLGNPSPHSNKHQSRKTLKTSREVDVLEEELEEDCQSFNDDVMFEQENDSILHFEDPDNDDSIEFGQQNSTVQFESEPKEDKLSFDSKLGGEMENGTIFNYMNKANIAENFKMTSESLKDTQTNRHPKPHSATPSNGALDSKPKDRLDLTFQATVPTKALSACLKEDNSTSLPGKRSKSGKEKAFSGASHQVDSSSALADLREEFYRIELQDPEHNPLASLKSITLYIQTELCKDTLEEYINHRNSLIEMKRKNPSEYKATKDKYFKEAIRLAIQIVNGLEYIHEECEMVHRDLKPSNILMTKNGTIKIGDFGLVKDMKCLSPLQPSPMISGSPTPARGSFLECDGFSLNNNALETNCEFELKIDDGAELSGGNDLGDELPGEDSSENEFFSRPDSELKLDDSEDCRFKSPKLDSNGITRDVGTKTFASPEQLSADIQNFDKRVVYTIRLVLITSSG